MARKIIPAQMEQYRSLFPPGYLEAVYGVDSDAQQPPDYQREESFVARPNPHAFWPLPGYRAQNPNQPYEHVAGGLQGIGMANSMYADFNQPYSTNLCAFGQNDSNLPRFIFPDPNRLPFNQQYDCQAQQNVLGYKNPPNVPPAVHQAEAKPQPGRNIRHQKRPNVRVADMTVTLNGKKYEIVQIIEGPNDDISGMNAGIRILRDQVRKVTVVEKRVKMDTYQMRERALAEKKALKQVDKAGGSPNVNRIYQAIWEPGSPTASLIIAHCNRGSLDRVIDEYKEINWKIPEKFCLKTLYDIAAALCMIHHGIKDPMNPADKEQDWNTICHLDIKLANVFLDYHGPFEPCGKPLTHYANWPRVILGDFGCSVTREDIMSKKIDHRVQPYGTPTWYPPEGDPEDVGIAGVESGCEKGAFGKFTDIWMMGGVTQAMCRLKPSPEQFWVDQMRGAGKDYTGDLNEAVNKCMARNITRRPTALDVAKAIKVLMDGRGY